MSQFSDSPNLATDNGDGKHLGGALITREPDLVNYTAVGAPMMAPVWQEQSASGLNLTKLMHSFRRRWMLAVFMGLLLGGPAALATWLIFPKQFEVQAMLQFRNVEDFLGDKGPIDTEKNKRWRETQLHLIRSPLLLTRTLGEPKVANLSLIRKEGDEPIYFLQKSISVYSPKDSDLVLIRMTGEEPREMVEIVRTLTEKYINYATDEALARRSKRIDLLQNQFNKTEDELRQKQEHVVGLMKRWGASESGEIAAAKFVKTNQLNVLQNKLARAEQQLSNAMQERDRLRRRQEAIDRGEYPEALLMGEVKRDPAMIELQKDVAEATKDFRIARSVAKYPQTDPAVQRASARLKDLREAEEQLTSELRLLALAKAKYGEDGPGGAMSDERVEEFRDEIKEFEDQIGALEKELLTLTTDSAELNQQKGEVERLQSTAKDLNERLNEAYLGAILPPPVDLIEPAEEPEGSTLMYRVILTTFLGLLSLCIGLGGVVMFEYTKQRVSTLNEIGYGGLGLRVLGTVPNLARIASHSKNGEATETISGILAESIDSVRTMLLSNKRTDAPKVILVTSADEHEGKTTVASHLAASLARAGRRTLLIDGDLRKPGIHLLFDMPLSAGLCEVLRGDAEIETVTHPAQVEGMWVMLAGQCDQRAIASLAKENAEAVFRTLRADYDFVVVDTGPALAFADTMLMGSHADAAVMAILRDVSQIPKVYEARERLEAIGLPVLGGVVGGMSASGSRSYAVMN
ncbi:MAG: polysaccharide biosynthesis tyrosine autokinase [Pirellulales bacterium]